MVRWRMVLCNACFLGVISTSGIPSSTAAEPLGILLPIEQKLQGEIARQSLAMQRFNALQRAQQGSLDMDEISDASLQEVLNALAVEEAELNYIELTLKSAQTEAEHTQTVIQNLQRRKLDVRRHVSMIAVSDDELRDQIKLLELQQKRIRTLQSTRDIKHKTLVFRKDWYKQLRNRSQSITKAQRQTDLNKLADRLIQAQQLWINQLELLTHPLSEQHQPEVVPRTQDLYPSFNVIATEEQSNLLGVELELARTRSELGRLYENLAHEPPLMTLNTLQKPLEAVSNHLQTIEALLIRKSHFLEDSLSLLSRSKDFYPHAEHEKLKVLTAAFQKCRTDYQKQLEVVTQLTEQAQSAQALFTRQLHGYISSRQGLPGLDIWAWANVLQQLKEIPRLFSDHVIRLSRLVTNVVKRGSWLQFSLALPSTLIWIRILILLRRFTKAQRKLPAGGDSVERPPSLSNFWVTLLHQHAYILTLCLNIWSLLFIWNIPWDAFFWLFSLVSAHLTFSVLIQGCYFLLVRNIDEERQVANKRAYYLFYMVLNIGRVITLLSLLVHQLILDYEVRDLVARLFMLFLATVGIILLRMWALVPRLLEKYWSTRSHYLKQVVRWSSFLLSITLLINAILGLMGYVQLAWAMVGYQSVCLLALCIYPFLQGLLSECFSWLSEQSIRQLRNGWLWSEALLKPLYQLFRLFTLCAILLFLFSFAGWRDELLTWKTYLSIWIHKPLITILDIPIDTWRIIQVMLMGSFTAWVFRWSKEFAYRWIFANLKDLGLRNSLSVLTEYTAISLSVLTTLQLIGITLSVLKYVLSGFAIGLSFGLRDLFNNFVTGILLLVERPLQVGDWITVGEYEGQVAHIGARSITVYTADHQELMVPNADLFYRQFVNWTRHDSIVRITLPLCIHPQDDPIRVRELIIEVIGQVNKILSHPAPEVYFKASDQMVLSFKIEYYVDLAQITSRTAVNSQFLFALWKRFKEENIIPPKVVHEPHLMNQLGLERLRSTAEVE